jgi:hypothetical protein
MSRNLMSINHDGLPKRDATIIAPSVEGRFIDAVALRGAIEGCGLVGRGTLMRRGEGGSCISVDLLPTYVLVKPETRGDDDKIDVSTHIVSGLQSDRRHGWDPAAAIVVRRKGRWFIFGPSHSMSLPTASQLDAWRSHFQSCSIGICL